MNREIHPPMRPFSLNEALHLLKEYPDSILISGGTHSYSYSEKPNQIEKKLPRPHYISLDRIEELRRISRTDRYLEFGAGVTLQRILQLGESILPVPMRRCLEQIGSPGLRRLATIGGNLVIPESSIGLGIASTVLDGSAEIRKYGSSRRIPVSRLYSTGTALDAGEIITRIRIPNRMPTHSSYQRFGSPYDRTTHPLGICGIAKVEKNSVESFAFLTAAVNHPLIRNRELEADIVGQRVPLTEKEHQLFHDRWKKALQEHNLSDIQIERSTRLFAQFLITLNRSRPL